MTPATTARDVPRVRADRAHLAALLDREALVRILRERGLDRVWPECGPKHVLRGALRDVRGGVEATYQLASPEHRFTMLTFDPAAPLESAELHVSPGDPRLDASVLTTNTVRREAAHFVGLPVAGIGTVERELFAHRVGSRMVWRLALRGAAQTDPSYVIAKMRRRAPRTTVHLLPSNTQPVAIPRMTALGRVGTGHVALFEWIAAPSLHSVLAGPGDASVALARVGEAVADLHARARQDSDAVIRTAAGDVEQLRARVALANELFVMSDTLAVEAIESLETAPSAAAFDRAPRVTAHGDLHDKQLLLAPDVVYAIDFDGAARAPAELDVGNLSAHLVLRAVQSGRGMAAAAAGVRSFVESYGEHRGALDRDAFVWAYRSSVLRLGLLYLVRIDGAPLLAPFLRESMEYAIPRAAGVA